SHDTKELTRGQRPLFTGGKTVDKSVGPSGMRRRRGAPGAGPVAIPVDAHAAVYLRATGYPQVFPRPASTAAPRRGGPRVAPRRAEIHPNSQIFKPWPHQRF